MILTAYDASNAVITAPWLDEPSFVSGATPSQFLSTNLPGWSFSGGTYTFTGASTNTLLTVSLLTNTAISRLEVTNEVTNGFSLAAPSEVPEPTTWATLGAALLGLGLTRHKRRS